jgi:hypothetical protein
VNDDVPGYIGRGPGDRRNSSGVRISQGQPVAPHANYRYTRAIVCSDRIARIDGARTRIDVVWTRNVRERRVVPHDVLNLSGNVTATVVQSLRALGPRVFEVVFSPDGKFRASL